jgi:hypothetical protein
MIKQNGHLWLGVTLRAKMPPQLGQIGPATMSNAGVR